MPIKRKSTIEAGINSDDDLKKVIGGRIKRIRKRFDRSASWVAERIGITRGALTQIENGRNNISAALLWKIASIFKCDIKDFFPAVPDSTPLTQADLNAIALEDTQAAEFAKRALNQKNHDNNRRKNRENIKRLRNKLCSCKCCGNSKES